MSLKNLQDAIDHGDESGYASETLPEMMERVKRELYQEILQGLESEECNDTFNEIVKQARTQKIK
ncbi:TPA: hypothetical protein ACU21B_001461 [Mannheimia haemolytica]